VEGGGVGVRRIVEEIVHRRILDDAAGIHHGNPIGEAGYDAEVVGDDDKCGVHLGRQVVEEIEDLRLDGDVECRGRFVGDQEFRFGQERHRDDDALAHAAGELMRIEVEAAIGIGNADALQHVEGCGRGGTRRKAAVNLKLFRQLARYLQRWIQGSHGILEDHGHVLAPDVVEFTRLQAENVAAFEQRLAAGVAVLGEETHQAEEGLALARAALADDGDALAAADGEVELGDCRHITFRRLEADGVVLEFEQDVALFSFRHISGPSDRMRRAGRRR
jgi:hypothetical protein